MQVKNMVAKPYVETNRITRLISFVDAHFDRDTGEPVSGGFFEVLNRLGRTDLDFGSELRELGALDESEKKYAKKVYTDKLRLARNPKQKNRAIDKSRSLWSDLHANPFYKQLSPVDRLIFEAFDSEGVIVINPAAATTLAQAVLENWFEVPQLFLTPRGILCQAAEQGDSHAAYLLGTVKSSDGQMLLLQATDRQKNVKFANRLGHVGARDAIAEAKEDNWRQSQAWENVVPDEWHSDWAVAKKVGPNASGERLLELAEQLISNARRLFIKEYGEFAAESFYEKQEQLAREWTHRAALDGCARAWHSLATDFQYQTNDETIDLLKRAASPGAGVRPFYPALIDLAEHYAQSSTSETDLKQANDFLALAIHNLADYSTVDCIRVLDLVEAIDKNASPNVLYRHYANYASHSAYSAFRAGLIALRACTSEKERHTSATHFRYCLQFSSTDHLDNRDKTALVFAEVALLIGWGGSLGADDDWDKAAMLLVVWLKKINYQHCSERLWLNKDDIQKLFVKNLEYHHHNALRSETLSNVDVSKKMAQFLASKHYAIGNAEPQSYIQGIAAIAFERSLSPEQLQRDYGMNPSSMLTAFLFGQLCLAKRFGEHRKAWALAQFEHAWNQVKSHQSKHGGRSINFEGSSLRWLELWTYDGLKKSQPNVWPMNIRGELDGLANEFGKKLIVQILTALGKDSFPTISHVVEVKYNDQYLYKPIAIALLASVLVAFKMHFEESNQWRVENLEITTAKEYTDRDKKNLKSGGGFNRQWLDLRDRDKVLKSTLSEFGIGIKLQSDFVQHERLLRILFNDKSELRVQIDKGMTSWRAVEGGEVWVDSFNFENTSEVLGKTLASTKVAVGPSKTRGVSNPSDFFIPCYVEWRKPDQT